MSEHKMTLRWERGGAEFSYKKYPRDHIWSFDGGHTMTATAAPAYLGNPPNVDPEEAFVASLSSCHMLTFLAIACKQKFVLDSYEDEALAIWRKMPRAKWRSLGLSYARGSRGAGIEYRARKNLIKCTTLPTRIVSLPTRSKPT
jgi:organic hydroperoxide reductase OsmC/OhrA